jgi:hypothetical protein
VLIQNCLIDSDEIELLIEQLQSKLIQYENKTAKEFVFAEPENVSGDDFSYYLEAGLFLFQLMSHSALPVMIIITNGAHSIPEISYYDNIIMQLNKIQTKIISVNLASQFPNSSFPQEQQYQGACSCFKNSDLNLNFNNELEPFLKNLGKITEGACFDYENIVETKHDNWLNPVHFYTVGKSNDLEHIIHSPHSVSRFDLTADVTNIINTIFEPHETLHPQSQFDLRDDTLKGLSDNFLNNLLNFKESNEIFSCSHKNKTEKVSTFFLNFEVRGIWIASKAGRLISMSKTRVLFKKTHKLQREINCFYI